MRIDAAMAAMEGNDEGRRQFIARRAWPTERDGDDELPIAYLRYMSGEVVVMGFEASSVEIPWTASTEDVKADDWFVL